MDKDLEIKLKMNKLMINVVRTYAISILKRFKL